MSTFKKKEQKPRVRIGNYAKNLTEKVPLLFKGIGVHTDSILMI